MNTSHLPKNVGIRYFFLFPSIGKLFLALALFLVWGFVVWPATLAAIMPDGYLAWNPVGFPFAVLAQGVCSASYVCMQFNWPNAASDIVFWYVVSAALIHTRTSAWRFLIYFLIAILLTALWPVLLLSLSVP